MIEALSINWHLFLCGISYRGSTLEEREPLQISASEIAKAHSRFASLPGILESTIVSTCNRVEFYFVGEVKFDPLQTVQSFYRQFRDLDISFLKGKFSMLVKTAARFECDIEIRRNDLAVDAKSIMALLGLEAAQGVEIAVVADGADEEGAIRAVVGLIEAKFNEEE